MRFVGRVGGALALASVSCAMLTGGCSNGITNSPADQSFVSAVHLGAPDVATYRSDTQLVRIGHAACDGFRSGAPYQEVADRMALLQGRNPLPSADLGVVITAAVDAYCPKYRSQV